MYVYAWVHAHLHDVFQRIHLYAHAGVWEPEVYVWYLSQFTLYLFETGSLPGMEGSLNMSNWLTSGTPGPISTSHTGLTSSHHQVQQTIQHSSMEGREDHQPPLELRSYWQFLASSRESQLSLKMWLLIGQPCLIGYLTHE